MNPFPAQEARVEKNTQPVAPDGFTLIELLVVITILVVLLALLVPAMEKAIYQAELAVCGTKLHGIATGAITYAVNFKRWYPHRPDVVGNQEAFRLTGPKADDRVTIRDYISINGHLTCPLAPAKLDLAIAHRSSVVLSNYDLWFGVSYKNADGLFEPGMFKMGDRFGWGGSRFNVLANDFDGIYAQGFNNAYVMHPDSGGEMVKLAYQDDGTNTSGTGTSCWWSNPGGYKRPPVDTQAVSDDGAVRRYEQVTWDEAEPTGQGRMVRLPHYTDANLFLGIGGQNHAPRP